METLDLLFNGCIVAKNITHQRLLPKNANFHFSDFLNVTDHEFTDVRVYVSRTKSKTTYYSIIKDNRKDKEQWLKDNPIPTHFTNKQDS